MLRANPPPPFSMLYKKEANSRDRKFNIEKGGGGSIVEIRKEICLKYSKMTKCLNTFVAHCNRNFMDLTFVYVWPKCPAVKIVHRIPTESLVKTRVLDVC